MQGNTWIVLTNSTICKIYHYQKKEHHLSLIKTLEHEMSKLKNSELTTDRPGHYKTHSFTRGAYEPRTDSKEVEIEKFMKEVSTALEDARNLNHFEHLVLIAPPHCLGLLNKEMTPQVKNKIASTIHREYVNLSENELKQYLKDHWDEMI